MENNEINENVELKSKVKLKPMVRLSKDEIRKKQQFIENYKNAINPSEGSTVDQNANVSLKTVATLGSELWKDCNIQVNRNTLKERIAEMFGEEEAEKYVSMIEEHLIYKHDESSQAPGVPYTYGPDECIIAIIDSKDTVLTTFKELYDLSEAKEIEVENGVWVKQPKNIIIADKDGFVEVTHLTKKIRKRDMVYVKTNKGEDLIVTDNHPLIINDSGDTVDAINSLDNSQYSCSIQDVEIPENMYIDTKEYIPNNSVEEFENHYTYKLNNCCKLYGIDKKIKLSSELGYIVGYFIGDGEYHINKSKGIRFINQDLNDIKNISSLIYSELHLPSLPIIQRDRINQRLIVDSIVLYNIFKNYFKINKSLPINILDTNIEFINGVIGGLIDSIGTTNSNNTATIYSSSRKIIEQLSMLFSVINVNYSVTSSSWSNNNWEITFENKNFIEYYKKEKRVEKCNNEWKCEKNNWKQIINANILTAKYTDEMEYIYDITTTSHTFICNGLWVHNCVAISLYPFLETGMIGLGGESRAPKHLASFCGGFVNLIFAIASQFAGAVAIGEFPLYFHHFAVKEYGKDYLKTHKTEIVNLLQMVIYSLNQPSAARGFQAVFFNFSFFDRYYYEKMFGNFYFPDGSHYEYDEFNEFQKFFLEWFRKEREHAVLTFPVITESSLNENGEPKDKEWADFIAEQRAKGHSFFSYNSDSADALASCCLLGDTLVTVRNNEGIISEMKIEDIINDSSNDNAVDVDTYEMKVSGLDYDVLSFNPSSLKISYNEISGVLKKKYNGKMIVLSVKGKKIYMTPDHIMCVRNRTTRKIESYKAGDLIKCDYTKYIIPTLKDNNVAFYNIESIKYTEEEYDTYVYDLEIDTTNIFLANGIFTHNCRLRNSIEEDDEDNEFAYTLGNIGVQTGSVGVMTLSLNRLVQTTIYSKLKEMKII